MEVVNLNNLQLDTLQSLNTEVIKFNSVYNITSEQGEIIVISREEYENLKEMQYFYNHPQLIQELKTARNSPEEDFINEEDFEW